MDEVPPYGERSRWRTALVVGAVLAFLVAAGVVACLIIRGVWRLTMGAPATSEPERLIMFPAADEPYAGPTYSVEFYDGDYRQLTDLNLQYAPLPGVPVAQQLAALAGELAARVRARDSQICQHPRVVLVNAIGQHVHEWSGAA